MEVPACRVCLATDTKLLSLSENNLKTVFEDVIGFTINVNTPLPECICDVCKARILRFAEFRNWCLNVQSLLDVKFAELSVIPKVFMQEIYKSFPKNHLAVVETFKIDISSEADTESNELPDVENSSLLRGLLLKGKLDGNTGDKQSVEAMLPLHKNEDALKNKHKIKTEEGRYEQYEVLDEELIYTYENEVARPTSKRNVLENYSFKEKRCKIEKQDRNPNIKNECFELNKEQECVIQTDCGEILQRAHNAKKTTKTKGKIEKPPAVLQKAKATTNEPVKRKYKKITRVAKAPKLTPVRRKYYEWLEALKAISKENLKKYDMKLSKVLTKDEQIRKMLARKETDKYKTSLFKCEPCCKGFMSEKAYNSHNLSHQPSATRPVECDLCHVYLGARSMKSHERHHRLELVCLRCGENVDPCKVKTHFDYHNGVKFECQECCKEFYHNSTYRNHVRIHHADAACAICGELFNGRNGVVVHIRKSHAEEAKEQCNSCEHYFCTKEALQQHLGACSCSNSPCGWCGVTFPSIRELADHIPKEHSTKTAETHFCTECGRSFTSELNLAGHWRRVHHDRPRTLARGRVTTPKPKVVRTKKPAPKIHPTICDQCGVTVYSNYLPLHMLRHTGEKPHQCPVCHKSFRIKQALGTHMMIHRGEKPFKCSECDTYFRQSCHLARHMRIHTGEKPFECEVCRKAFSLKVNKEEHVRTVHEGLPPRRRKRDKDRRTGDVGV